MHWIVAFAAPLSDAGRSALGALATPRLDALLAICDAVSRDSADERAPSPPHERAWARAIGWRVAGDEPLPWAARAARADGIAVGTHAWGLLTPVHWRVGSDAIHLADPRGLDLDEHTSRTLFDAVRPLFESEGFTLAWGAPLRWYAAHPSFAHLATASLDRVIGRSVDPWLPAQREARLLRRLQNEVQMLLHAHPANAQREVAGALVVNSFWLSGCGALQPETPAALHIDDRLAQPALAEDWPAWQAAWMELEAALCAPQAFTRLTLCGERGSVDLVPRARNLWQRIGSALAAPRARVRTLLETL
jgi:hypothetical protein